MSKPKIIYIVSSSGAAGGGMGRVKDYILASGGDAGGRYRFEPLVTRDDRGAAFSVLLLLRAILTIWWNRLFGRVAFVHVNLGDKGSALRKGLVILGARLAFVPVVLHLHAAALIELHAGASGLVKQAIRLPFLASNAVIVLGRLWRDWLVDALKINPDKIDVLYNGVPVEPTPRRFSNDPNALRKILFLGLLTERKGISDFLHALAAIPAEAPPWQAIIAGNGDIEGYTAKAHALGLAQRTHFTGWVEQKGVRELLAEVDMMVLPSYHEGLPLVILEALGAGAPVICTPVGAIPEVLEHGRDVILIEPGDRAGLAHAMAGLLRDPAKLQDLSDHGIARFCETFALDVFLLNLFAIYERRLGTSMRLATAEAAPKAAA
ncbi:MAG: glycosyltransferase family 4 protein [Rhizobiales bacterium]|nr:glycosyltransferase family 4 protein [Hyphomicrobiales bacterium]